MQKAEDAKMEQTLHRHDITDGVWGLLQPHLPGQEGQWGGIAEDNRRFINAVFWIVRTGAPWRDLPPEYGKWGTVYQRFNRWRNKGIWERLLELLIDEPDNEWLMIDASHIKVHPHGAGAAGGNQDMERTKGAQHQDTSGRGCAWYASQNSCYSGYLSGLQPCYPPNRWHYCRILAG
jgi:transposase